jgi:hypothetical protein
MRRMLTAILYCSFIFFAAVVTAQDRVKVSGVVTYFDGSPVAEGMVVVLNDSFTPVFSTTTNEKGEYLLEVDPGRYCALAAVKDYKTKNLEFWAWNVPASRDLEINARIDRMEVYGMNAFRVQGTTPISAFIYFRPMSLTRATSAGILEGKDTGPVIEIAPELTQEDIEVTVDGEKTAILQINRVMEAAGEGKAIIGYLIQATLPQNWKADGFARICVAVRDRDTGERGEGILFWETK